MPRFMVLFDHPSAAQRKALWRSALPPRVPLASDVDFEARRRRHPKSTSLLCYIVTINSQTSQSHAVTMVL